MENKKKRPTILQMLDSKGHETKMRLEQEQVRLKTIIAKAQKAITDSQAAYRQCSAELAAIEAEIDKRSEECKHGDS